jgi:hypothetical protein
MGNSLVTGNGPHTILGLAYDDTFSPTALAINEASQLEDIRGYCELLSALSPHSYVAKAPHSQEVENG